MLAYRSQTSPQWTSRGRGIALVLLSLLLVACAFQPPVVSTPVAVQTASPTQTQAGAMPTSPEAASGDASGTALPEISTLYAPPHLPAGLLQALQLPQGVQLAGEAASAGLSLVLSDEPGELSWVYALVAPFPTLTNGLSFTELKAAWGGEEVLAFAGQPLLLSQHTYDLFAVWWGQPDPQAVQILPAEELLDYAWGHQPSWALIPFEAIEAQWKVLEVDGQSPLRNTFDSQTYPLTAYFNVVDSSGSPGELRLSATNRDPAKLTVLAMTGVTALVRGTALWMERYGITYPAQDVGALLRQADLTHISNEIPFFPDCPFPSLPTPVPTGQPQPLISFCSSPDYLALLEEVGADLVELTGDHFADWGDEAMQFTLELYASRGLPVYGGGMDTEQARQPLLLEHNGNKLAFLGCNIGWPARRDQIPASALAGEDHPGAAQCDFDWLSTEIPRLRAAGYQVIFTYQHREYDRMKAEPLLVEDFGLVASYGATVVSGSQAHQPHSMTFQDGAFIHYGLGNLFFDQYHFCAYYACDYAFIDQHIFFDNRYLGVELVPIVFVDLARPRLMSEAEATAYLAKIFEASGWTSSP